MEEATAIYGVEAAKDEDGNDQDVAAIAVGTPPAKKKKAEEVKEEGSDDDFDDDDAVAASGSTAPVLKPRTRKIRKTWG